MGLFQKLKSLFGSRYISDEARAAYERSRDLTELKHNLDDVLTRNEVELKAVQKEYEKLEAVERLEADKVRSGKVEGRQKRYTLQAIKRTRLQLDNLEQRMAIYDRAIRMQLNLIAQIQNIEAMALTGIDEAKVDAVVAEHDQRLAEFTDAVEAIESSLQAAPALRKEEDAELAALEAELTRGSAQAAQAERIIAKTGKARADAKAAEDADLDALEAELRGDSKAAPAKAPAKKTPEAEG